jgi:anti-sigma-K factor RskA
MAVVSNVFKLSIFKAERKKEKKERTKEILIDNNNDKVSDRRCRWSAPQTTLRAPQRSAAFSTARDHCVAAVDRRSLRSKRPGAADSQHHHLRSLWQKINTSSCIVVVVVVVVVADI